MKSLFEIASNVSTPLALSGIVIVVLYALFKQIIARNIFPQLTQAFSGEILKSIIDKVFVLALVARVLGFAGWVLTAFRPGAPPLAPEFVSVSLTSDMTFEQAAKMIAGNDGGTVIFPECTEPELGTKVNGGTIKGASTKELLETLQYRLTGASALKYRVEYLRDRGLYEIHCPH
jgi:hypothetical protein